ncbi:DNA-binding NarL/FixJ family response regulator [Streptosporangium becharense]|uniref:DNA-binding NarL/FixJ family response regulator n=1 Tax=Streptosporangium becharense TaxID=1816182 RepID=A0A7W9IH34_9ACTN|nr:response regulator transcription factor [Streptosporangium becharense]MBB2912577.1 DNA-binding NarL/FixJ family response regulator [Streptosporangium becharense]MBB5820593.1 DNA-binding NarL/FixJ family response regulator [Streptosporangium becharense]
MRLILADDSVLLREGLARLLRDAGHEVTAAVGDAGALLDAVAGGPPDVVIVDVRMPPSHTDEGLRAALKIRDRWPGVGVLVLSQYVERTSAARLLAGPSEGLGYLLKDRVSEVTEFLGSLERVGAGGTVFDPEVVRRLLAHAPLSTLTARERDVLEHLAQGMVNTAIAERLHVSQSTVEKHVNAVFDKLGLTHVPGYSRRVLAILRYLGE